MEGMYVQAHTMWCGEEQRANCQMLVLLRGSGYIACLVRIMPHIPPRVSLGGGGGVANGEVSPSCNYAVVEVLNKSSVRRPRVVALPSGIGKAGTAGRIRMLC